MSAQGGAQLEQIADLTEPGDFDAVYSSPLSRARKLASTIGNRCGLPVTVDERITEIAMGPWQGLTRTEIERDYTVMLKTWHDRPDTVVFPGGESLADVSVRVDNFFTDVFNEAGEGRVLVVSHDTVIKVTVMLALGLEMRFLHRFRIRNGSLTVLRGPQLAGSVETVDSISHLLASPFDFGKLAAH